MTSVAQATSVENYARNKPSTLTYRQRQLVALFVFLAKKGRAGATRRDCARALKLSHTSGYVTTLLNILVRCCIVSAQQNIALPRSPFVYYAHRESWQS